MWNFIAIGFLALMGAAAFEGVKEEKEKRKKEEQLWNHGFCPKCGNKYKVYSFFPPGSRGKYKHISIKCRRCRTSSVLELYKPPESEFQDQDYTEI